MTFFNSEMSIVENLYYLSGTLLLISLLLGIYQLHLTKKVFNTTSKREAASIAMKQIEVFTEKIVPLLNKLFESEQNIGIVKPKIKPVSFTRSHIIEQFGETEFQKIKEERKAVILSSIEVLNSLEAFSVYFTNDCADKEIGYSALGRTFCESIEGLYFDLSYLRPVSRDDSFPNIIQLYKIWNKKFIKEKLNEELALINHEMNNLNSEG